MAAGDHDIFTSKTTLDILASIRGKSIAPVQDLSFDPYSILTSGTFTNHNVNKQHWLDELTVTQNNNYITKYQVSESVEDVLALSTAWFRLRQNVSLEKYPNVDSLTDPALFPLVREEDRLLAETIRDYYSKRCMMWALKEVRLTPFRKDLAKFILTDGKVFTEEMLPLVFRLPEFYKYDTEFAEMVRDLPHRDIPLHHQSVTEAHNLRPLRKFVVKHKNSHKFEYWFKDENGYPTCIVLDHLNQCISLFEREFRKESMNMKITGCVTNRNEHSFFKVASWKVE